MTSCVFGRPEDVITNWPLGNMTNDTAAASCTNLRRGIMNHLFFVIYWNFYEIIIILVCLLKSDIIDIADTRLEMHENQQMNQIGQIYSACC